MDRKNYSRPFMAFEKFTPQEFVASCDLSITAFPNDNDRRYSRIDWNHNGHFDLGERGWDYFGNTPASGKVTLLAGTYTIENVNVYKFVQGYGTFQDENYEAQANLAYDTYMYNNQGVYITVSYVLKATQLVKSKYGKYYFINGDMGSESHYANQS